MEEQNTQLVVLKKLHRGASFYPMTGQLRFYNTLDQIMIQFYWPGMQGDVRGGAPLP